MTLPTPDASGRSVRPVVLIADDDRDMCELLCGMLQDRCELLVAFDGDNALTIAHRCQPDAALIDVMMLRLSGFGLLWAFRHHPMLKTLPVAFLTAHADVARRPPEGCLVLLKPFAMDAIRSVLDTLLKGYRPMERAAVAVEHRRTERFEVSVPARLVAGEKAIAGRLLSISLMGAFFHSTTAPPPVGTTWRLCFDWGGKPFDQPAEVIHNLARNGVPGAGLWLHDLGLDGERRVEFLLEALMREPTRHVGPRPLILVVDDDRAHCEMVRQWLLPAHDVVLAHDGDEGRRLARRERPDVVLLETRLPRLSGKSLSWQLRQDPSFQGVPIVYATAHPAEVLTEEDECLLKPFTAEDLARVLGRTLQGPPMTPETLQPNRAEGDDARYGPRYAASIPADLSTEGRSPIRGQATSLLLWGCVVEAAEAYSAGMEGRIALHDPDGEQTLSCRVLCTSEHEGRHLTGLRFRFAGDDDERAYRELLGRYGAPLPS